MSISVELPWPPSVNGYLKRGTTFGGRRNMRLTEKAHRFRFIARVILRGALPYGWSTSARYEVRIVADQPDRRRHDLDNILKATLDALTHGGVYDDDSYIDFLSVKRGHVVPGGRMLVNIQWVGEGAP